MECCSSNFFYRRTEKKIVLTSIMNRRIKRCPIEVAFLPQDLQRTIIRSFKTHAFKRYGQYLRLPLIVQIHYVNNELRS